MTDRIDTAKARDSWITWIDDLPLPHEFHEGQDGLQEFIARTFIALEAERAENERLRYVLDGVAAAIDTGRNEPLQIWRDQIKIARAALNPEGEATSGSSKWGPQFPPASCTAYEDCAHDGVCHDPNCGAPAQHGKGGEGEE